MRQHLEVDMAAPLYVLGLGPGGGDLLTFQARKILESASCIAGYELYLNFVPEELKSGKKILATGMKKEEERCLLAIESARQGLPTALVCSGDAGIYAMASPLVELLEKLNLLDSVPLEIAPGVPAFCAAAALLGAPLGHDFACISLSDLLTPWQTIENRLKHAFLADFVCVIYNPRSRGRPDYLARAMDLARECRPGSCPVGMVKNAFRPAQEIRRQKLDNFDPEQADMLSLVIIGNSQSRFAGPYMLTPRGYQLRGATNI